MLRNRSTLSRSIPLALGLLLLAPALPGAVHACLAGACAMPERTAMRGHECCPPPANSVRASCCGAAADDAPAALPEGTSRPVVGPAVALSASPGVSLVLAAVGFAAAVPPTVSPPTDPLTLGGVLRI